MPDKLIAELEPRFDQLKSVATLVSFLQLIGVEEPTETVSKLLLHFGTATAAFTASKLRLASLLGADHPAVDALPLARRLSLVAFEEAAEERPIIANPRALRFHLVNLLAGLEREEFHVMFVLRNYRLVHAETMFTGTLAETPVWTALIIKRCLELSAAGVIVAHNHPSGDPRLSEQDRRIYNQLEQACTLMGLHLFDALVVGGADVMRRNGVLL